MIVSDPCYCSCYCSRLSEESFFSYPPYHFFFNVPRGRYISCGGNGSCHYHSTLVLFPYILLPLFSFLCFYNNLATHHHQPSHIHSHSFLFSLLFLDFHTIILPQVSYEEMVTMRAGQFRNGATHIMGQEDCTEGEDNAYHKS